jgi:hypothetical protein
MDGRSIRFNEYNKMNLLKKENNDLKEINFNKLKLNV